MQTAPQHRSQDHPLFEQLEPRLLLDALGEPYLQAVDANSVYVLLEADTTADAEVKYGLTSAYGDTATTESTEVTEGSNRIHNIQLTGLLPNTQYHYQVIQGGTTSADYTFWTAPPAGTDFRFAWMADPRSNPTVHGAIAGLIDGFDPRFSLYGGDLCNSATRSSWNAEFFVPEERALIAQVPFFNAVGNHEAWNAVTRAFTQGPDAAGEANGYYSIDYGDLHVLVLNTEIDYSSGSDQWNFAASDLAASSSTWNIVTAHKPAYSSNRENADMQAMTTDIFEPNGVDMVLAGHDHYYEHNLVNGIHHMVIGSAGAPLYTPNGADYTVYGESTYNFAIFDMTGTTLDMTTYRDNGSVIETLHLSKGPDITPPTLDAVSATSPVDVEVVFSEPVDQTSAELIANYAIDQGVTVSAAVLQGDTQTVLLTVSALSQGVTYTLTVNNVTDRASTPNPIASDTQAGFQYAPQTNLTFQQGVGGYAGATDTMIRGADSTQNFAAVIEVNSDTDSSGQPSHALFGFDNIIGGGPDQIAPNSTILSATLRIRSTDDGNGGSLHPMLLAWDDTVVTWANSFGGDGIQADDIEAALIADDNAASNSPNTDVDYDVTATLQAWANGASNEGWALLPNGTNGFHVATAEYATVDYRPELIVTFQPAIPDPTPPTVPTDLTAIAASTSRIDLSWTAASDPDSGIGGYNIYRDSVLIGSTAAVSYSDTGLSEATDYTYEVSAVNGGSVEGPKSSPVIEQTLADTTAPTLDSVLATSPIEVVVAFSEPVEQASAETMVNYAIDPGVTVSAAALQGDTQTVVLTVSTLSPGVTYTLTVNGVTDRASTPNPIVAAEQTFEYVVEQTATFQQGAGGYAATLDTYLLETSPDADNATATALIVDTDEPAGSGGAAQGLLQFGGIFGSGPGQIPLGAQIVSAQLDLQVINPGNSFDLHRMVQSWTDADAWNSFGADGSGGVQVGSEALAAADATTGAVSTGTLSIDVAAGLQAWASDPATNFGWVMLPSGTDGVDFDSAEGATPPTLSVTFTPGGPNNPPVAVDDDLATTGEDTPVIIDVLANDSDPDSDTLTVDSVTQGLSGSVVNNGTDVTYTPNLNFNGLDSFTYTVTDGRGGADTATVSIMVSAVNDTPVITGQSALSTAEETSLAVTLADLTVTDPDNVFPVDFALTVQEGADYSRSGNTITPATDFNGTLTVPVTVSDGTDDSGVFNLSVTVTGVNDAPVAANDAYEIDADDTLTVTAPGVSVNDTDVEGDTLTVLLVNDVTDGVLVLNGDGSFTYTPEAGFDGTDSFTYKANDGLLDSNEATVTITVNLVPSTAISVVDTDVDDTYQYDLGGGLLGNINLAPGNTNPRGATASADGASVWVVDRNKTVYLYDADGAVQGSWTAGEVRTPEGIATDGTDIWIVDGRGKNVRRYNGAANLTSGSPTADHSFALDGGNSKPKGITTDGSSIWVVNNNTTDAVFKYDMSGTLVGSWALDSANVKPTGIAIDAAGGSQDIWIIDNGTDQIFRYDGAADVTSGNETADAVFDLAGGNINPQGIAIADADSSPGPVPNAAPVANDDSAITSQNTLVNVDVLANDTDLENDPLMIDILATADGTAVVNDNGTPNDYTDDTVDFTPDIGFQGGAWFTYLVNDGLLDSNEATVTIQVTEPNDIPVAADDPYLANEDVLLSVNALTGVLANDTDANDDPLTAVLVSGPSDGALTLNGDGSFSYMPNADFHGADSFTYKANDGIADSNVATVTITVNSVNDAPTAADDAFTVAQDSGATNLNVLANDSIAPDTGETLTITAAGPGSNGGSITVVGGSSIDYTPAPGFFGTETFSYTINDGTPGSNDTATVTVTVAATTPVIDVTVSNIVFAGVTMSVDLANNGAEAVTIQQLLLNWVRSNKKLRTITGAGGEVIYDSRTGGTSVLIDTWIGDSSLRTIGAGQTLTLTFEFEKTASDSEGDYGLSIDFGDGLQVFL